MNSDETRRAIGGLSGRVDQLDHTLQSGLDESRRHAERRDQIRRQLVRLVVVFVAAIVAAIVFLGVGYFQNADAIDRQTAVMEAEAARACERGNKSIEVDRMIINGQFDDYLLTANVRNNPEARAVIEDRRAQRLRTLEELRPVRACPEPG